MKPSRNDRDGVLISYKEQSGDPLDFGQLTQALLVCVNVRVLWFPISMRLTTNLIMMRISIA